MHDIKYTSDNGYTGILYGESSMSIYNPEGREVMHTGFRNVNTMEELIAAVEGYPEFIKFMVEDVTT